MYENSSGFSASRFCGLLLNQPDCGEYEEVNNWSIDIPGGKPMFPVEDPPLDVNDFIFFSFLFFFLKNF